MYQFKKIPGFSFCQFKKQPLINDQYYWLGVFLQDRGAFRRFKDRLFDLNLEQKWYDYRDRAYERIAKEWCEKYNIDCCDIIT